MNFLYPLGLLALLAIPVLILIYIIKNRYTEQTIASTYLWTLSEKFLRRRVPINRLTGIISLILQILAVLLIAVILAHPILYIPDAANAYCFILDGSGSMNITQNDKTRFEMGKEKITEIIQNSMNGSTYTLIYAGNSTDTIYEDFGNKERAIEILNNLSISYAEAGLTDALGAAQSYFNENPYALTYLVTDKKFETSENVSIINVSTEGENYAVYDITYETIGGILYVSGMAISYESDATLTLNLYFDNSEEVNLTQELEVEAFKETAFKFESAVADFSSMKIEIAQSDALALDNEVIVYNVKHENISPTLIVSDDPFIIKSLMTSIGNTRVEVVGTKNYKTDKSYGLYIFDCFVPETMPREGAVWFINPQSNVEGTNFSYQGLAYPRLKATYSKSTSSSVKNLLNGTSKNDFELYKCVKLGTNGKFTTLISCEGNPMVMAGTNVYGNREVIFAFDLHDAGTFTLHSDCTSLMSNLINYSFPEVIDNTSYYCGEIVQINMITGCKSIRIETPLGKSSYPDTTLAVSDYQLTEVGTYVIYLIMNDNSERTINVYSAMPLSEREVTVQEAAFIISGAPESGNLSGIIDDLLIIFIILAVIAVADYGVYCYEQYQLR